MLKSLILLSISYQFVFSYIQTEQWFNEQKLDHTSPMNRKTWAQRYFVIEDYFDHTYGTVLLYICGEYTCPGVNPKRLFVTELAQRYKSLILAVEHRYYGISMPLGADSLKLENLKYLGVQQALDDLAYFMLYIKRTGLYGVKPDHRWYAVGGSYPGALAAWFRYKYPHLTVGALASSAVVQAIDVFPEFDGQIYDSTMKSGVSCQQKVQLLTNQAEEQLQIDNLGFKKRFGAQNLNDGEFLFFFADIFVEFVQYGKRKLICDAILNEVDPMQWVIDNFNEEVEPESYGSYYLKNDTFDPQNLFSSRAWMYQTCTEVGWLQTAPSDLLRSMRSQQLNEQFYRQLCKDSFGVDLWPDVQKTNSYFGGWALEIDRLILTNGDEDPWKHASITIQKQTDEFFAYEIICDNCAHCVELYTPTDNDSPVLKAARSAILMTFDDWIPMQRIQ